MVASNATNCEGGTAVGSGSECSSALTHDGAAGAASAPGRSLAESEATR